jgi:FHA domain
MLFRAYQQVNQRALNRYVAWLGVLESPLQWSLMHDVTVTGEANLEIIAPDTPLRSVHIGQTPFLIGRGSGNQLQLSDGRISRSAAAIFFEDRYYLEDRGQRGGVFLNGKRISKDALEDGDTISFALDKGWAQAKQHCRAQGVSTRVVDLFGSVGDEGPVPGPIPDETSSGRGL